MPAAVLSLIAALALTVLSGPVQAHGSVSPDNDLCIIRIGYYRAHFKVYQPQQSGHDEFCEDIPAAGEAVFVMEYQHSGLGEVPIDFRIIRNVTGHGRFTTLNDVSKVADIDAVTVFHHPAEIQRDVFTALTSFDAAGEYVGIVRVTNPDNGKLYTAVFPFAVGFTGFGWWPWFALAAVVLQVNYLWMSGWFSRRRKARYRKPELHVVSNESLT